MTAALIAGVLLLVGIAALAVGASFGSEPTMAAACVVLMLGWLAAVVS